MVRVLLRGPLNVSEISDVLRLSQSNVSHNLRILLDAGIVIRKGRGSWVYYNLNRHDSVIRMLIESISEGASNIENHDTDMSELTRCYASRRMESKQFFDRIATEWDHVSGLMPDPESYISDVLDMFPVDALILDAGCGSGELVLRLARRGTSVIGVDQSQEMISEAGKKLFAKCHNRNVELRLGTAEHLPVADSSVDGIIAHMLLHHLGEPPAFFTEAARVCVPGGRCAVIELIPHDNMDLKRTHGDLWPGLDQDEVRDWMLKAGFKIENKYITDDGRAFILSGVFEERNGNG
ncbi:MAG: methyltransferase domain-containing protein [Candidatus Aegiribacteria sp.]|nr:methyltransferase domain-containing protein [Candidatus Aegiribacteria sp.]